MAVKAKKQRKSLVALLKGLAILCLIIYGVARFITQQAELSEAKNKIAKKEIKLAETQQQFDEYSRLLNMTDEEGYMERIAIELLGYAYPNERRFYDTSRN